MHRLTLLPFMVFFSPFISSAQHDLTVIYHHNYNIISFNKQRNLNDFDKEAVLYVNGDSVSFYSYTSQQPDKKKATVGSRKDHHAVYWFPALQTGLSEFAWQKPFKLQAYIPLQAEWKLYDDTMRIAGYLCKVAVADGLVAWYAPEISAAFGPPGFNGLPGLVLMVEDHRYKQLIKAASIKFESPKIVLPDLELKAYKDDESKLSEIRKYFTD